MPLYEYNCEKDGLFELFRPVGLHKHPAPCPTCGKLSPRAYTIPNVAQIDPTTKKAIDRNIKAQHEPHICGSGCGHEHHGPPPSHKPKARQQPYNGPRPWVIEHAV